MDNTMKCDIYFTEQHCNWVQTDENEFLWVCNDCIEEDMHIIDNYRD